MSVAHGADAIAAATELIFGPGHCVNRLVGEVWGQAMMAPLFSNPWIGCSLARALA